MTCEYTYDDMNYWLPLFLNNNFKKKQISLPSLNLVQLKKCFFVAD